MGLAKNKSSRSWTINHDNCPPDKGASFTSDFQKFRLLLWKNYKIQVRHKIQTITEILLPLLFTAVLVIVRNIVPSTHVTEPTIYRPLILENSPPGIVITKCNEIYYTPNNPVVEALMQNVNTKYFLSQGVEYNFTGFDTEEELVKAYIKSANDQVVHSSADFESTVPVLAGVVFKNAFGTNGSFPKKIQYSLRFPATQRSSFDIISERFGVKPAWFTELIYPLFQLLGPRSPQNLGGGLPGYSEEGFLYLQYALDRTLTREFLNASELENYDKYDIKLQRFPYPDFIDDKYLFALQGWLPLIVMLSFIYPVINITKSIVYEKEKRLKEYMKIMGIKNRIHWMAWFTKSFIFLIISVGLMTLLLKTRFSPTQDLAVLPETDGAVIFFIFTVFTFSLISFAFFVSTLFAHASAGATCAGVLWFVFYVPYGFLQPRYNLLSRGSKLLSCFLTNTAIAFACQIVCMFEGTGAGLQWETIFQGSGPDDNFSMGDCLLMMIVNGVFYMISAFYIEAIRPGEFGVPLPWNFFIKSWFWSGKPRLSHYNENDEKIDDAADFNELIEAEPLNASPGIQIKDLTKIYNNGKAAVKKLSLNFYEGQVTAFLGHNGAGKTTTLSILSGMFPPTSGTALINNCDITKDLNSARSSLGLTPQYDILFDELTVEEHLRFYCLMKGCKSVYVDREINKMLKSLGLENKRHEQSHTLSGGMKRKLSVGIAFCGGSKVVLLDEATSGMDPGARRSTWDLIKNEKKKRTIVLSTHFMEEADVLGDRIAIMANGEIQCCGSSLFLKKKYGGGYHLTIVKEPDCDVDKITDVIKKTIPDIEIDQDVGAELSYSLPENKSHLFPQMFEELESTKKSLGIASYGASITTMEEVFIRVGQKAEEKLVLEHLSPEDVNSNSKSFNLNIENHDLTSDSKSKLYQDEPPRNVGMLLRLQQFRAMITKKVIYASRNRILLLAQMGIPILYLILILIILSNLPGISDPPEHQLSLKRYEKLGRTITSIRCPDSEKVCKSYKDFVSKDYLIELVNLNQTFVSYMLEKENKDLVTVNFRYILGFDQRKGKEADASPKELVGFFNNQPFHSPPLSLNFITNSILQETNRSVSVTNHPFPLSSIDTLKQIGSLYTVGFQIGYNIAFGMSFLAASFSVFIITERESRSKHIQFVSGVQFPLYWIASLVVDFLQFTIPCFGIMGILLLFRIEEFFNFDMQLYLLLLLMCYGLAVIPLMYLWSFAFTVASSGFTRLVLFNIFTGMATMLTVVIIQIPEFHLEKVADILNTIFLIFPNYALGMGVVQLSTNYQVARDCAKFNLEYICSAFPETVCCAKLKKNFLDWERVGIGKNICFLLCAFVICFAILFIVESKVLRGLFSFRRKQKVAAVANSSEEEGEGETPSVEGNDLIGLEDSDVLREKERIQNSDLSKLFKDNTLIVKNLTKKYKKFVAVDHINLGVQRGECFGLLGINGAGKTSTFKMLTGDLPISGGDAFVCSRSVRSELKKVHEVIGYCPQFDALVEEMTGRETIKMYARLRGIKEGYIERLTNCLGEVLLFSQHMDKRVETYSGGNKRKLSTAIALIGSPPIIFLDEMTTGMDPVARRHMWTAISKIRDSGTSVVLTSHSMEECEALCTRLAIMVNGTFRCLGGPQQLKNKFGEGYTLIAQITPKSLSESEPFTREKQELGRRRSSLMSMRRVKSPQKWESELDELRAFIEDSFPGCSIKDIHPGFVHYQVPGKDVTWGEMFSKMEIAKERFNLEGYSVGQCSLEQVFLAFTKGQLNVD